MSLTRACDICRFWYRANRECRRYPPQHVVEPHFDGSDTSTQFPVTEADDWCGEFQPGAPLG